MRSMTQCSKLNIIYLLEPISTPVFLNSNSAFVMFFSFGSHYSGKDYTRGTFGLLIIRAVGCVIFFVLPRALRSFGKDPSTIPIIKLLVAFPSNALSTGYLVIVGLVSLAIFLSLQRRVSKGGGGVTEESEWSFGQILVLTTWAPAIIQIFYTLFEKRIGALLSLLPKNVGVVELDLNDDNNEHHTVLQQGVGK
ncbi:hypothetical protein DL98DRAFT_657757 [Cadophora sp. DSE1049]|nr:hypothetical protein DL98DRAFT_657757 [Cadophora sp. DSE1049]